MGAQSLTTRMTGDVSRADECRRAFMRSMEALVPLLEEAGLRASIEPHPRHFVEHNDEAVDLIREIGSPYVGYLYCMAHTFWLGDDAARMIRYAAGTLTHVHVADTHRPERIVSAGRDARPHNHFIPGWGEVDFESTFRALLDMGYDGYLSAELYSHPDDPAGAIRQTREKVSALLARLAEERQRA
jgi:myo-inositol catabolism protein IolH